MSAETSNEETLAMAAGALLSVAFSYLPGLQERSASRTLKDLIRFIVLLIRFFVFIFVFLIRFWFPSRMSCRIRFIHEKHRRVEQPIWVRWGEASG